MALIYMLFLCVITGSLSDDIASLNEFASVFLDNVEQSQEQFERHCENIVPLEPIKGCYECYPCDNDRIRLHQRNNNVISHITITSANCNSTSVCCVSQNDLQSRSGGDCGTPNPGGVPRGRRSKVRSVLQGEHPWRAWVYQKQPKHKYAVGQPRKPLCAATLISKTERVLIVPASCVKDKNADDIEVAFTRKLRMSAVSRIVLHQQFDAAGHKNDIAGLQLRSWESFPEWALPACLPDYAPPHATPCNIVSGDDLLINNAIPLQSDCVTKKETALPESQLCAVAVKEKVHPEYGAGLYCTDPKIKFVSYTVYGMAIDKLENEATIYTNVSNYIGWLNVTFTLNLST